MALRLSGRLVDGVGAVYRRRGVAVIAGPAAGYSHRLSLELCGFWGRHIRGRGVVGRRRAGAEKRLGFMEDARIPRQRRLLLFGAPLARRLMIRVRRGGETRGLLDDALHLKKMKKCASGGAAGVDLVDSGGVPAECTS